MKTRYIFMAAAALVVSACAKTNEQPESEGMQITIHAYQEGAHTKTTVQDGGTQVYWEPSDEIKVFFKGNGGRFVSQNTEAATVADFSGTLNVLVGANEGASSTTKIFGLYPYMADATSDGSSVTTTLPAEQTGRAGSFAKNTHISLAATNANSVDLGFYNVTGGLRFSLTQEGIKSVTFEGNNGETLAGKIKLDFEGGVPAIQEVTEGEAVLTLTAPGGGTFQTGKWYYIEAIPGTLSKGFKMVFSKGSETAKVSSSGSVTISRGRYGSLADADEGLIFKESGGDEPNPSSVIQFADPIAKYACVEKFDTDGDGEVSFEEAAAATSLSGLFKDWNTVTSFDEIKYFTGVKSTNGVFDNCSKLESVTIPDFITSLGSFKNCSSLKTAVLPNGLTSLPKNCFDGCSVLIDITLPESIESIPDYCFQNCSSIETLSIPSSVTTINKYAFSGCSSLVSISLPAKLEVIGDYAFRTCSSLTYIAIENGRSIGQYSFFGCSSLVSVVLPSELTIIPKSCFRNCSQLSSITWPSELTTIEDYAFYGCSFASNNYTLELPVSVASIGSEAFGLRHLIIPSTAAVSITESSFQNVSLLYVPANMVDMYKLRTNWIQHEKQIKAIGDYPSEPYWCELSGTVGEPVDLGLSVNWASWNIGASTAEEFGAYFAWGEVEPKWEYTWSSYKWCDGDINSLTKYNSDMSNGICDYKTTLDPEDDAAKVIWGGKWRMPTFEELKELYNCTWTWATINGINGFIVTSNKSGYTDKSIFLPASGYGKEFSIGRRNNAGRYWSSECPWRDPGYALCVGIDNGSRSWDSRGLYRMYGGSVRPVCPKD